MVQYGMNITFFRFTNFRVILLCFLLYVYVRLCTLVCSTALALTNRVRCLFNSLLCGVRQLYAAALWGGGGIPVLLFNINSTVHCTYHLWCIVLYRGCNRHAGMHVIGVCYMRTVLYCRTKFITISSVPYCYVLYVLFAWAIERRHLSGVH